MVSDTNPPTRPQPDIDNDGDGQSYWFPLSYTVRADPTGSAHMHSVYLDTEALTPAEARRLGAVLFDRAIKLAKAEVV